MKRSALFLAIAACLTCASLPLMGQDAPPDTKAPAGQHPPMPKPTNLQVLPKDISTEDLIKQMRGFSQALGVQCTFCHAMDKQTHKLNFAADTKEDKGFARTMIAMTQDINSKFMTQINDPDAKPVDKTVTCGTCHRGNTMPAPFTPKPEVHKDGGMQMQHPQ
jgi:hypothetical protein